jgi:hypothetical protein
LTPLTRSAYLRAVPSTTPDQGTILLYTLSTLAQTCAALAALVGAVGLFRLQLLRTGQDIAERNLRGLAGQALLISGDIAPLLPIEEIVNMVTHADPKMGRYVVAAHEALAPWRAFPSAIQQSRNGLIAFEAWNLLVIGASLVGFNYIPLLVASPWTFWSLWIVALGTVAVTTYSVFAWTRG